MFGNDAEKERHFLYLLENISPAERAEVYRGMSAIADLVGTAAAAVGEMIAECSNPDLAAQSWDAAQRAIQLVKGGGRR